jgi:hypothetical protein
MELWRRIALTTAVAFSCSLPSCAQCGFSIEPADDVRWYREQGWDPPGLRDAKKIAPIHLTIDGKPKVWPEGLKVWEVLHDDRGYQVKFPEAIFEDGGAQKKMLARSFELLRLLRWDMNGTPYAYSYDLGSPKLHCFITVDIIDDRGDGKFRLMTSPGHTSLALREAAPPVPGWLNKGKS